MAAYVIVDVDVTDPEEYQKYKDLATPTVAAFGGRYLARGGKVTTLESDWAPTRLVILEFPSAERAKKWWDSTEYRAAKQLRHKTAKSRMIIVEGV